MLEDPALLRQPPLSAPVAGLALVTGASGGIGEALAHEFARGGAELVLVARSADRLAAVAADLCDRHGATAVPIPLDLAAHDGPERLVRALQERGLRIRHLVNNAGFGLAGPFAGHGLHDELELIDLNVRALTEITHRLLPDIVASRGGILNVASVAAFLPGPGMASYYASKAYVLSFSEALSFELRPAGVTVTALCPGPVPTGFQARAGLRPSPATHALPALSAASVAARGYRAYRAGERVCLPGATTRLAATLARLSPRGLPAALAARFNRDRV